jgi:D-sedoheptulose 7-phosphate isomerase
MKTTIDMLISNNFLEHLEVANRTSSLASVIRETGELLIQTIRNGSKVFICGNGGSAADAQHFAAELTGRFERERRALPAVALTTDTSALTAIGNDYGFDFIFSRQLEALARPGDLLVAISTSGNSRNVLKAVSYAKENQISTIGLLGRDGGQLAPEVNLSLVVPTDRTARIQEMHILIVHIWCEMLDASIKS